MAIKDFFYFCLAICLTKGRILEETPSEGTSLDETVPEGRSSDVFGLSEIQSFEHRWMDPFESSNITEGRQGTITI